MTLHLTRLILFRRLIVSNPTNLCSAKWFGSSSSAFLERQRREMIDKFDETNSEVFNQLKKWSSESSGMDWQEIRNKLIKEYPRTYNKFNFEVQFMQHLLKIGNPEDHIIKSFTEHVKKLLVGQNNKVVQCHLIRFLLLMEQHLDVNYIRDALESVSKDEFFIKYPVVGKAWAEFAKLSPEACKQSIEFAMQHPVLKGDALTTLICNTLKYRFYDDAESLLSLYADNKLSDVVVSQWVASLIQLEKEKRITEFDRFVRILCTKRYLFQKSMLSNVESFLNACGLHFVPSTVDKGSCKECRSPLVAINEEELARLRVGVEERLVNKYGEVYTISTPVELANFNNFMESHASKPFDLVIDGLNVSYYNTSRAVQEDKRTNSLSIKNLGLSESLYSSMEINGVFRRYKKILVIGRKHMASWPSIKQLKENHPDQVWVYLLDNKSEDDIFTIYAAIRNVKTHIWTADFLRQYKDLLGSEFADLFEKWKFCRQVRFAPGSKRKLEFPYDIDYVCQSNGKGQYHFPINMNIRLDYQERIVAHWMCVKSVTR